MKIYTKDEEMGTSTAQAIKADGTHVFFDDSGCMTNAEKKYNEKFTKKWVRDYVTSEWIEADKAVVVKADVTTPMKYNYIFFANEESANKYIKENKTNGVITDWTPINTEAAKRYKMRMQKEANMKRIWIQKIQWIILKIICKTNLWFLKELPYKSTKWTYRKALF